MAATAERKRNLNPHLCVNRNLCLSLSDRFQNSRQIQEPGSTSREPYRTAESASSYDKAHPFRMRHATKYETDLYAILEHHFALLALGLISTSSTSNLRVEFAGMMGGYPPAPYACRVRSCYEDQKMKKKPTKSGETVRMAFWPRDS